MVQGIDFYDRAKGLSVLGVGVHVLLLVGVVCLPSVMGFWFRVYTPAYQLHAFLPFAVATGFYAQAVQSGRIQRWGPAIGFASLLSVVTLVLWMVNWDPTRSHQASTDEDNIFTGTTAAEFPNVFAGLARLVVNNVKLPAIWNMQGVGGAIALSMSFLHLIFYVAVLRKQDKDIPRVVEQLPSPVRPSILDPAAKDADPEARQRLLESGEAIAPTVVEGHALSGGGWAAWRVVQTVFCALVVTLGLLDAAFGAAWTVLGVVPYNEFMNAHVLLVMACAWAVLPDRPDNPFVAVYKKRARALGKLGQSGAPKRHAPAKVAAFAADEKAPPVGDTHLKQVKLLHERWDRNNDEEDALWSETVVYATGKLTMCFYIAYGLLLAGLALSWVSIASTWVERGQNGVGVVACTNQTDYARLVRRDDVHLTLPGWGTGVGGLLYYTLTALDADAEAATDFAFATCTDDVLGLAMSVAAIFAFTAYSVLFFQNLAMQPLVHRFDKSILNGSNPKEEYSACRPRWVVDHYFQLVRGNERDAERGIMGSMMHHLLLHHLSAGPAGPRRASASRQGP